MWRRGLIKVVVNVIAIRTMNWAELVAMYDVSEEKRSRLMQCQEGQGSCRTMLSSS